MNGSFDDEIKISPNPSSSILNIDLRNENQHYQIMDFLGNNIYSGTEKQLNIEHFSEGIYFVKSGTWTAKFIKH